MRLRANRKVHRFEVLLVLAVLMPTAGLLAVPGLAGAATATSLTASSLNTTITWGGYTIVTGTLMDTSSMTALGGKSVRVEWSPSGATASWRLLATVTTDPVQYYTGQYAAVVYPASLTYYRFVFNSPLNAYPAFDPAYATAFSNTLLIHVKPYLTVPKVPSSVKANKNFTITGTLKPQFPAGAQTVKIQAFRYKHNKWSSYKTYKATNANSGAYTKYSLTLKLGSKGKYRFQASAAATTTAPIYSAVTTGNSSTLKVK